MNNHSRKSKFSARLGISIRRPMFTLTILLTAFIAASAQTPTLVSSFSAMNNGLFGPFPSAIMAQGRDGNLYGTTDSGGPANLGGVFVVTPSGTETTLHSFAFTEGSHCNNGLTLGSDGNFYGACVSGGANVQGSLFGITPAGVLTILHNFTNTGTDGGQPSAPPFQASDGNFYGATLTGGTGNAGTIYKLTLGGMVTTIHSLVFPSEGGSPSTPLMQGNDGNLYGTTLESSESGVIFKITLAGKLTVLHNFATADGELPKGALIQGQDGNFYGTTNLGGSAGEGTVFKMTPTGKFSVLENFDSTIDGQGGPWVGLVQATDSNFYGVNLRSGLPTKPQLGGIYKLTSKGAYSSLYLFDGTVGTNPASPLLQHTNGLLYGDTQNDGGFNVGTVYSLNVGAAPFCSLLSTLGKVGASIGILGQGFAGNSVVKFGGVKSTSVTLAGSGYLTAVIPAGALTGPVTVATGTTKLTSKQTFRVTPTLKSFSPPSGPAGTTVTITGTSLTQTSKVAFNGTAASFVVNSDTQISATVPTGATTGKISLTTKGGNATSTTSFTIP